MLANTLRPRQASVPTLPAILRTATNDLQQTSSASPATRYDVGPFRRTKALFALIYSFAASQLAQDSSAWYAPCIQAYPRKTSAAPLAPAPVYHTSVARSTKKGVPDGARGIRGGSS